jgi:hypothetical protein
MATKLQETRSLINMSRRLGQEPAPELLERLEKLEAAEAKRLQREADIRSRIAQDLPEIFSLANAPAMEAATPVPAPVPVPYREGGSITHDGVEYDFDTVMSIAEKLPTQQYSVDRLSWILKYDTPDPTRTNNADISFPLIVSPSNDGRLAVIDGLHRLNKAVKQHVKTLPVKYIEPAELKSARINKQQVKEQIKEQVLTEPTPRIKNVADQIADSISRQVASEGTVVRADAQMPADTAALEQKVKYLENWVSRIAATGPGGGEVNLRNLDDVARSTIADGRFLRYNAALKKFDFATAGVDANAPLPANAPYTVVSYSATPTLTVNTNIRITCTSNITINPPAGTPADGAMVRLWLINPTSGGAGTAITVTLNAGIRIPTPSVTTSAIGVSVGIKAVIAIQYDATSANWQLATMINGYGGY